jgi:hypothetical protein
MYSDDIVSSQANVDFMQDEKFIKAYNKCLESDKGRLLPQNYSIRWRIHTLLWASQYALNLEGDYVDLGGGFGIFASAIYEYLNFSEKNKKYFLLDSFEGLNPETTLTSEKDRINHFKRFGNWHDEVVERFENFKNIKIIKGFIPETLGQIDTDKISFASIDLNSVEPEKFALEFTWEKLVRGGIIILDDYGFPGHIEQKKSHDRFIREKGSLIYTCPTGQGIIIK